MIDIERLRQLCAKGLNRAQIAQRLGVTHNAVHQACQRHGIPVVPAPGYPKVGRKSVSTASAVSASNTPSARSEVPTVGDSNCGT